MQHLLALAIESRGGQDRWSAIRSVTAELSIGGVLWEIKGKAGILSDARCDADVHVQRAPVGILSFDQSLIVMKDESTETH
jgi:hypothetical protein